MKTIAAILIVLKCSSACIAQFSMTPYAGINNTRVKEMYGYTNGGNYLVTGAEIEWQKKQVTQKVFYISLASGAGYLENGFYKSSGFSFANLYFSSYTTDLRTKYFQVPFIIRFNWQPFPLIDDWKIFLGAGVNNNFLISAKLAEKSSDLEVSQDIFAPPYTISYQDSRDITKFGPTHSLFRRIEIGTKFKRVQVIYRVSVSLQDMHFYGVSDNWNLPAEESWYLKTPDLNGGTRKEKYIELCLGYKLF